jgi:hypothetical protein
MGGISAVGIPRAGVFATLTAAAALVACTLGASRLDALAAPGLVRLQEGGSITGLITTKEPAPSPIRATIDPGICGQSVPNESVMVAAGGQLANVVVSVKA